MFVLTTISDLVQIPPHEFYKLSRHEVEDKINEKYANKVIQKIGLCMRMYDLLKVSDGLIGHGDGFVNVNAEFRLVVFRPFKGEILMGRVADCNEAGIRISMNFFTDIFVPANLLFDGTRFDEKERTFIWQPPETPEESQCYFDVGEIVRLRVESEEWHDQAPTGPVQSEKVKERLREQRERQLASGQAEVNDGINGLVPGSHEDENKAPYVILASMCSEGLGGVSWW